MFPINFKVVSDVVLSNSPVIPWLEVPVITFIVIAFVYVRVIRNKFASDEFTVPINIADWYISNGNLTELPKTYSLFLLLFYQAFPFTPCTRFSSITEVVISSLHRQLYSPIIAFYE